MLKVSFSFLLQPQATLITTRTTNNNQPWPWCASNSNPSAALTYAANFSVFGAEPKQHADICTIRMRSQTQ